MGEKTSCFELAEGINWVGVVDWNIRDFHGYITRRGSTYNSYLITDKKNSSCRYGETYFFKRIPQENQSNY